jgi:aspartate/methionine/tyrosine aminotransferase
MSPGPVQAAAIVALGDDAHVDAQRQTYLRRLTRLREIFAGLGYPCEMPAGAFYLWIKAPTGDAWAAAREVAERVGIVVSPGDFYGDRSSDWFRVAAVQPDDRIELAASRR